MTDYSELVKALRCKRDDCEGCDLAFLDNDEGWMCQYAAKDDDAADAIEALQAQLPKLGKWVETEEKEWGIYPFKKQTCSVCDCKIDHIFMLACMDYFDDRDTVFHYCPNCGAKMEVQDGQ